MLDVEESMLDYAAREQDRLGGRQVTTLAGGGAGCEHLGAPPSDVVPSSSGECAACLRDGSVWVPPRMCTACGNVACCDSSVRRHANAHFEETGHPVMRSAEPGEDWRWCFVDRRAG